MSYFITTVRMISLPLLVSIVAATAVVDEPADIINASLAKPIDVAFEKKSLVDTILVLQGRADTPIVFDALALEEVWIDPQTTLVTYNAKKKPLANILDEVLAKLELVWIKRHDVLVVTTPAAASERFSETRLYKLTRKVTPARRVDAIRTSVAPESWKLAGGKGDLSPLPPSYIVIFQSPVVHRQIAVTFAQSLTPVESVLREHAGSPKLDKLLQRGGSVGGGASPAKTLTQFAEGLSIEITLDQEAFKTAEIDPNELKIKLHNEYAVPIVSLLSLTLELAHRELIWFFEGDKIKVTTKAAAMKVASEKTYDVKEIVSVVDGKYLVEAIEYNISAASWEFGGGDGKIELADEGKLIVNQNPLVHRELDRFLGELRKNLADSKKAN